MLAVWLAADGFSDLPASWQTLGLAAAVSTLALSVVGVFSAVWKGALVPGPTHRRELAAKDDVAEDLREERDMWRTVALKAMGQTDQLMPGMKVTQQVMEAFPRALGRVDPEEPRGDPAATGGRP